MPCYKLAVLEYSRPVSVSRPDSSPDFHGLGLGLGLGLEGLGLGLGLGHWDSRTRPESGIESFKNVPFSGILFYSKILRKLVHKSMYQSSMRMNLA